VDRDGRCHQVGQVKLSKVEKVKANWWSPRLLEALTARFVVLVEGAADRVIVESVAEHLGVDFDRIGAAIIELDGADKFKNVFPLLGPDGFGPTLLGLVDEAESGSWVGAFGGKPRDVIDAKVFISAADLEDEYTAALGGPAAASALINAKFCQNQALLQSTGVDTIDKIDAAAVAKFCRSKGKVEAATCIAEVMTPGIAKKIGSVARLVGVLQKLSSQ
jgi:putative ATP-dependent endonuclease of the OLD family